MFLAVYVDDFEMSGPKDAMKTAWGLIRRDLVLEDPTDIGLYLGCLHEKFEIETSDQRKIRGIRYNTEDYLRSTVEKYCTKAENITGQKVKLKRVATPFTIEDQRDGPSGMPAPTGPCAECPWRKHTFPTSQFGV